jgi:hypothetical protein
VNFLNSFAAAIALMMKAIKRILFISKNKDTNPLKNKLIFKELLIVAKLYYHKIEKKKNKF